MTVHAEYPTEPELLVYLETQYPQPDHEQSLVDDDTMLDAIDELPYELRIVVESRIFGKMTWREIGDHFGYSRFTAKDRWLEALALLQQEAP